MPNRYRWLDYPVGTPQTSLSNAMRWMPRDDDSDVEVPPWSWLAPQPEAVTE
jgi:hypothetical protein